MIDFKVTFEEDGEVLRVHAKAGELGETEPPREIVRRSTLERLRKRFEALELDGPEDESVVAIGQELFKALFPEKLRRLYDLACGNAERQDESLRAIFNFGSHSTLHGIPLELLHDGSNFIAKHPSSAVVRAFEVPRKRFPMQVGRPLRVLLTSSSPSDLPKLDLAKEEAGVRLAYASLGKDAVVTPVNGLSLESLSDLFTRATTDEMPFHVWHHSGHGGRTRDGSAFWLNLERGGLNHRVSIPELRDVIGACAGLRVVVLNCCHAGSLAGLAPELARLDVPVVIGFPRTILDDTAIRFATVLHRCLTRLPVELALSLARRTMAPGTREWCLPLLLSRRTDQEGLLVQNQAGAPASQAKRHRTPQGGVQMNGVVIGSVGVIGTRQVGLGGGSSAKPPNVKISGGRIGQVGVIGLERLASSPSGATEGNLRELLSKLDACLDSGA